MEYVKTDYRYSMYRKHQPRKVSGKRLRKSSGKARYRSLEASKPKEYRFGVYKKFPGIKPYGYQRLYSESEDYDNGNVDYVEGYGKLRIAQGNYKNRGIFHRGQQYDSQRGYDEEYDPPTKEKRDQWDYVEDMKVNNDMDLKSSATFRKKGYKYGIDRAPRVLVRKTGIANDESKQHRYVGSLGKAVDSSNEDDGYVEGHELEPRSRLPEVERSQKKKQQQKAEINYEWDIDQGQRYWKKTKVKRSMDEPDVDHTPVNTEELSSRPRKKKKNILYGMDNEVDSSLFCRKDWKTRPHNNAETEALSPDLGYRYRGYASNNAFRPGRYLKANGSLPHKRWPGGFGSSSKNAFLSSENVAMKPKVVTIVRNGKPPRNSVKLLLNRRSVQSFEQLMADIIEAFGPKWKNNKVHKLFTVKKREVQGISDFFRQDDMFIACNTDSISDEDVRDILHEMYPDGSYGKQRDWEKSKRKKHAPVHKEIDPDKRDSGFGEASDGSNSNRDSEQGGPQTVRGRQEEGKRRDRKNKSKQTTSPAKDTPREAPPAETPQEQPAKDAFGRGELDDRERARRRQLKMAESEKRALEEDKRKRGLVPLRGQEDPFKRMKDREKEKLETRKKRELEKKRQLEELEKEKRKKEFEEAEKAARARKAAAEKEEREREARERAAREKLEKEKAEEKGEQEKAENKEKADAEKDKAVSEKDKVNTDKDKVSTDKDKINADKDKENANKDKVKEKDNRESEKPRKRQKPKIVRRTKAERLIADDEPVLSKYDLGRTLGDGNFAIVRTSKLKATGHEFAIKVIDKPKLKGKEHMVENEIEIMKDCNHHNIVKLYEEYETPDKLYLVMELVKGGDLFDAITQSVKFGEVDSANMVKDLCHALFYLHSRNIVHRDLKPENLLVHRNKDGTITLKLADFGLAMDVKEPIFTVCGTPTYVAPEILSEIGYGLEVDMWAVGVISYILLCGFPPFRSPDRNQTELFEFIKAGAYEFLSPYWDYISDGAKDMIQHLLIVDKKRRYTAIETLSHPWIIAGGDMSRLLDSAWIHQARHDRRKELEIQAKLNLESYTQLKEKRRMREE